MQKHIEAIRSIFCLADRRDIALWLESGWAIDARLGKITREHEDIDIAFPSERQQDYLALLYSLGFGDYQEMDYGFLMSQDGILLDCEPCRVVEGEYVVEGFPKGSCPLEKEGQINGFPVRCLSWDAMYFEFLGYMDDVPREKWRDRDVVSLEIIKAHVTAERQEDLKRGYSERKAQQTLAGERRCAPPPEARR